MDKQIPHAIACAVINKNKSILLLKRSPDKKLSPNKWFVVGAYPLSEGDDFEKITHRELVDELGIDGKILVKGQPIKSDIQGQGIIVHPFLAEIPTDEVRLNSEHTEFKWVLLDDIRKFDTVDRTYDMVLGLMAK